MAMACDVLLIIAMIAFLLKYGKTMQAMLVAFLQTNTKNTAIQSVQADRIGRTGLRSHPVSPARPPRRKLRPL